MTFGLLLQVILKDFCLAESVRVLVGVVSNPATAVLVGVVSNPATALSRLLEFVPGLLGAIQFAA